MITKEQKDSFFNEFTDKTKGLSGIDVIYLIDGPEISNAYKLNETSDYSKNVLNIINSEDLLGGVGKSLFSEGFHTYTLLNESGLILITKLNPDEKFYLIIVAGENAPVDLINLFKICKEARQKYISSTQLSA